MNKILLFIFSSLLVTMSYAGPTHLLPGRLEADHAVDADLMLNSYENLHGVIRIKPEMIDPYKAYTGTLEGRRK